MIRYIIATTILLFSWASSAAMPLSEAIKSIADKYNVIISFSPTLTNRVTVTSVPDATSADGALSLLTADTDFKFRKVADGVYYVGKDKVKIAQRIALQKKAEQEERTNRKMPVKQQAAEQRYLRKERLEAAKPGLFIIPGTATPAAATEPLHATMPIAASNDEEAAPKFAIKTNALMIAALSPNLAIEMRVGKHFTVELPVSFSHWNVGGCRLNHIATFPALKYWLNGDAFDGDYVGVYGGYAHYDIGNAKHLGTKLSHNYYAGNLYSAGVIYGHRFNLNRHLSLEPEIGIGYVYVHYKQTPVDGGAVTHGDKHKFYLTRLALNVCYTF